MKVLWSPQKRQAQALACNAFELLYGGAAGGGKSDFLLVDFIAQCNAWRQDWKGILFRRTYPEMESIIDRARQLFIPLRAVWNKAERTFYFPTGSKLQMRFLEKDEDVTRYQGQAYTWVGFDELGNYPTDYPWRYMMSRARSAAGAPCYIRGTANPGGPGHAWIKARFIDGLEPGKIYKTKEGLTRSFVKALIQDNKKLLENDPDYLKRLEMLPTHLRRALLEGDWDVFAGQIFDEFRREKHVVKPFALPQGQWKRFYSLDWGFAKPFSLGKWAVNAEGRMIRYGEWYGCAKHESNTGIKMGVDEAAARAWADAVAEGVTECVADPAIWSKNDTGPSTAEKWEVAGFKMIRGNNDRINGLMQLHQQMLTAGEDGKPMLLVFDHCVDFIRTIPVLVPNPRYPEDVDTKLEDHIYDESRYAAMSDFVHHPVRALRRMNGSWNFGKRSGGWDPLADRNTAWNPLADS
ncbi:MAG: terminase family protein [Treponema sp.]|jgi:hypothetical protein|nr:terminase family protein [Treponema sp.]